VPLDLQRADLPHLPGAPLRLAIIQVRYRPVLGIEDSARVDRFRERLGDAYELLDRQTTSVVRVFVGDQQVEQPPTAPSETLWRFQATDSTWTVALTPTSLGFEATTYTDFNEFAAEFERVLGALAEVFSPRTQTRIGVRYINEINDERAAGPTLRSLLRDELVTPVATELGTDVISTLSDLRFRQPDGLFVLRHGLVQEMTYLLDFDYFNEEEVPFDVPAVRQRLRDYHGVTESVFVWSLQPEYLAELRDGAQSGD
jgi:uncharacterized protein (TIGR04255 family)